jgi:hypothetical protein
MHFTCITAMATSACRVETPPGFHKIKRSMPGGDHRRRRGRGEDPRGLVEAFFNHLTNFAYAACLLGTLNTNKKIISYSLCLKI